MYLAGVGGSVGCKMKKKRKKKKTYHENMRQTVADMFIILEAASVY